MDSFGSGASSNLDLTKLSDRDKQELQQFVVNESQKARIQQSIHSLTDICFRKCITGRSPRASSIDTKSRACRTASIAS
ncbi:Mitochondrial import inner membrane translocase subunit tim8 [Coniosporium tulheliwenetii]|uniref:Mitochondrial import inner membrane translocase subunit tim8 n=1 Tax=Coniosporium tulheliwenetii TaxID=3383036 RepID=A0ACC2Z5R7_9PEZI|nr:Mitochondrial import inner membrane translocase subunit tim8 [Cladosporium sp. JES 115]